MKKLMRNCLICILALGLATGCQNTLEGAGDDIENAGEEIEDATD